MNENSTKQKIKPYAQIRKNFRLSTKNIIHTNLISVKQKYINNVSNRTKKNKSLINSSNQTLDSSNHQNNGINPNISLNRDQLYKAFLLFQNIFNSPQTFKTNINNTSTNHEVSEFTIGNEKDKNKKQESEIYKLSNKRLKNKNNIENYKECKNNRKMRNFSNITQKNSLTRNLLSKKNSRIKYRRGDYSFDLESSSIIKSSNQFYTNKSKKFKKLNNNINSSCNDIFNYKEKFVGEKIEELNNEIKKFKQETKKVKQIKTEYEKLQRQLTEDMIDFKLKKKEFEKYKEEELNKIKNMQKKQKTSNMHNSSLNILNLTNNNIKFTNNNITNLSLKELNTRAKKLITNYKTKQKNYEINSNISKGQTNDLKTKYIKDKNLSKTSMNFRKKLKKANEDINLNIYKNKLTKLKEMNKNNSKGVKKEKYIDGYKDIIYKNGDIKQICPNEKDICYFKETNSLKVIDNNGNQVYIYDNGRLECHFVNGNKKVYYPDGTQKLFKKDKK